MEDLKNMCENGEEFWDACIYIYSTSLLSISTLYSMLLFAMYIIYICMHKYIYMHIYIYMYIYIYVYIIIYICVYVCVYMSGGQNYLLPAIDMAQMGGPYRL